MGEFALFATEEIEDLQEEFRNLSVDGKLSELVVPHVIYPATSKFPEQKNEFMYVITREVEANATYSFTTYDAFMHEERFRRWTIRVLFLTCLEGWGVGYFTRLANIYKNYRYVDAPMSPEEIEDLTFNRAKMVKCAPRRLQSRRIILRRMKNLIMSDLQALLRDRPVNALLKRFNLLEEMKERPMIYENRYFDMKIGEKLRLQSYYPTPFPYVERLRWQWNVGGTSKILEWLVDRDAEIYCEVEFLSKRGEVLASGRTESVFVRSRFLCARCGKYVFRGDGPCVWKFALDDPPFPRDGKLSKDEIPYSLQIMDRAAFLYANYPFDKKLRNIWKDGAHIWKFSRANQSRGLEAWKEDMHIQKGIIDPRLPELNEGKLIRGSTRILYEGAIVRFEGEGSKKYASLLSLYL